VAPWNPLALVAALEVAQPGTRSSSSTAHFRWAGAELGLGRASTSRRAVLAEEGEEQPGDELVAGRDPVLVGRVEGLGRVVALPTFEGPGEVEQGDPRGPGGLFQRPRDPLVSS